MTKSYLWQWLWLPNGYLDVSRAFVDNRRCGMMEPFHMDNLNVCEMKLCLLSAARHTLMLLLMRPNFSTLLMHMHVGHPMTLQTIVQLFVWAIIGSPELVFVFWRNSWIQKCARLVVQNGLWYAHVVSSNFSNWSFRQCQNVGEYSKQKLCLYRKLNSWLKIYFKIG